MSNLTLTADHLSDALEELGFIIMSERSGAGLPLVAFRFKTVEEGGEEKHYDEFSLAHQLRSRSWVVPAYTMAPHTDNMKMLRVVVREDFSKSRCDMLIKDIKLCMGMLEQVDSATIKRMKDFTKTNVINSHQATHSHHKFKVSSPLFLLVVMGDGKEADIRGQNEKHSLQGKTGKTHGVC